MTDHTKQLADALAWYAEQARLARLIHSEGDVGRHAISADGGAKARAALAAYDAAPRPAYDAAAWEAGRDAAAQCAVEWRNGGPCIYLHDNIADAIRATTPPVDVPAWQPPEDRPDGYECLAMTRVRWRYDGWWATDGDGITLELETPITFAPLPATPEAAP